MNRAREPANKKLRSSEPDLVVVVDDEQKEYHYHSQVMATHSKVIDAMLDSPMKERQTMHIHFPDLSAEVWESMIYFLDPATSRQMTVRDALQVAAAYDEYDFCAGANCCDQVFFELFGTFMPRGRFDPTLKPEDLNQVIDVFLLADAANLKQTKKCAVRFFKGALNSALGRGQIMFSKNQIKKLVPLIAKENLLEQSSFTNDEILQSLFPKFFIMSCVNSKTKQHLKRDVTGLRLSGTSLSDVGFVNFFAENSCSTFRSSWEILDDGEQPVDIIIERLTDDWVIYEIPEDTYGDQRVTKHFLWKNPFTAKMLLPPKSGWVLIDGRFKDDKPWIEYLYRTEKK